MNVESRSVSVNRLQDIAGISFAHGDVLCDTERRVTENLWSRCFSDKRSALFERGTLSDRTFFGHEIMAKLSTRRKKLFNPVKGSVSAFQHCSRRDKAVRSWIASRGSCQLAESTSPRSRDYSNSIAVQRRAKTPASWRDATPRIG